VGKTVAAVGKWVDSWSEHGSVDSLVTKIYSYMTVNATVLKHFGHLCCGCLGSPYLGSRAVGLLHLFLRDVEHTASAVGILSVAAVPDGAEAAKVAARAAKCDARGGGGG
jgi:hypothetical protein